MSEDVKFFLGALSTVLIGLNVIWLRFLNKKFDGPKLRKMQAEADSVEIKNMEAVLTSIQLTREQERTERAREHAEFIAIKERVALLEERERHNLVRSIAHEGWDKIAYKLLLQHYPDHEPPPPLHSIQDLELREREFLAKLETDREE